MPIEELRNNLIQYASNIAAGVSAMYPEMDADQLRVIAEMTAIISLEAAERFSTQQ